MKRLVVNGVLAAAVAAGILVVQFVPSGSPGAILPGLSISGSDAYATKLPCKHGRTVVLDKKGHPHCKKIRP